MGDGELQEGQNWEAIMFASSNKVDELGLTKKKLGEVVGEICPGETSLCMCQQY